MEFDKLFTESVLNGIRSGDRCALDQLQTIIHAMIDEIIRLEKNNEKLRNRGQLMVTNYADLERQILELKCKKSADLDESRQEIIRLKLQVQRALGDANNQALVTDSDKKTLERVVEEKNRFLIKIKAENLVLKNQLEEQGLTIAQSLSDSAITHGVVVQLRHALDSIVALQNLNQSLLESYAHDLRQSQHSYTKTRLLNDELQR
uniref:Uncharacterized protein n=1 Tax=Spongospora subterranea TaxID=70186 RepID=A0A0H5QP65_9EUKA|eukprot:CRZ03176.1 hypothetical protein [Spongospora subterranea]